MSRKTRFVLFGGIILSTIFLVWVGTLFVTDEVYDKWEISNSNFKVRITAFREKNYFDPGSYYLIESAAIDSDNWSKIISIKRDGQPLIPPNQARFVDQKIGYVFISSFYLVTKDAGKNWIIWDSVKVLDVDHYIQEYNLSPYIDEVEMDSDGMGRMKLKKQVSREKTGPELLTKDFGIKWELDTS